MASQFSKDGKYFAQISAEGKLKIWQTVSNSFEQEFTPDFHLSSPCTSLDFLQPSYVSDKIGSPQKKRRSSHSHLTPDIALGTSSGRLLIYSITKGSLDYTIDSQTSLSINCLSSCNRSCVYSGADTNVLVWNLQKKNVCNQWKAGDEKIGAVLIIPNCNQLLTATKQIILWDVEQKEKLKVFTGHSSAISSLDFINPRNSTAEAYFISGSKRDRLLSCWSLSETADGKNAIAKFSMEAGLQSLSVIVGLNGATHVAATLMNGVVLVYQQILNGKCNKVLKHKTRIQVVSDANSEVISPIHISGAIHRDEQTLCIGYGNSIVQTFETITISSDKKDQCIFRKDPQTVRVSKENQVSKVHVPIIGNDVHYLTPQNSRTGIKRKSNRTQEIPMERRLENLTLNNLDSTSDVPKADNVAQLLVQGLHSKDKTILYTVLCKRNETAIRNTIKRLPMPVIIPLVQELTSFIQGKTLSSQIGSLWLKNVISVHAGLLLSNPELPDLLESALRFIESRLSLQMPLNKLRGRLNLLESQVNAATSNQEKNDSDELLLVFNDKASSDSDENLFDDHSSSDNEWVEESIDGEDDNEELGEEDENDEDVEMSN